MEPRLLLAYAMIAVLVLSLVAVWYWISRDWRRQRRGYRENDAMRRRRRDERLRDERAA
jgi:hypothetical protein